MINTIAISLIDQADLTPLREWFTANPSVTIVSINLDSGTFYVFYTDAA